VNTVAAFSLADQITMRDLLDRLVGPLRDARHGSKLSVGLGESSLGVSDREKRGWGLI
jgi:hypothetical protein